MLKNRTINAEVEWKGYDHFKEVCEAIDRSVTVQDGLTERAWNQFVTGYATKFGIDTDIDKKPNLVEHEKLVRVTFGEKSKRPGGKKSLGTGYTMPKTPKTYLHWVRKALDSEVELLDADGNPRELAHVKKDLDDQKVPRTPDERGMAALEAFIKTRDAMTDGSDATVDVDNRLINWMKARGYDVTVQAAAAA